MSSRAKSRRPKGRTSHCGSEHGLHRSAAVDGVGDSRGGSDGRRRDALDSLLAPDSDGQRDHLDRAAGTRAPVGVHTVVTLFGEVEAGAATEVPATFTVRPGEKFVLAVLATNDEPVLVPSLAAIDGRLDATKNNWRRWSALVTPPARWSEEVTRSALVLKSLLAEYTGAIAAAATTSLPEKIGGPKNWDYRFSWVRDSSFAIDALINLELSEEFHSGVSWLLQAIRRNGPELHVLYTLEGKEPGAEKKLEADGYRQSQPVRSGNGAARQRQLGNYGDVFDTVYRYVSEGNLLDVTTQSCLCELAQRCCKEWRKPDSGIWELHQIEQYTISKIGCSVALDRALKIHEMGQLRDADVAKWEKERDAIREFVEQNCWSDEKRSYTFYAGTDQLDASVLLCARTGFDVGERLVGTIDAVSRELRVGPWCTATQERKARAPSSPAHFGWLKLSLVAGNSSPRPN